MWRRVALMARKETRHIMRDARTMYLAFGIPLVLLAIFGYALSMDIDDIRMLAIDHDQTAESRELIDSFSRTGFFLVVDRPLDDHGLLTAFRTNRARVGLIIPRGYAKALSRGEPIKVQFIVDGTDANVAAVAMGYAGALVQSRTLDLAMATLSQQGLASAGKIKPPLVVKSRNWFNPDLKSQWYMVPGLVAVIMAMMSAILMALTVAREWERGTMEQLLVTPARPVEILMGKLLPYYVIGLGQLTLVIIAGVLLFSVPIKGSLLLLYVLSSIFLIGGLSQGMLISVITRQQQLAMQFSILSSMLPAMLLSGFMAPIASMPHIIQLITYVIPARYFLTITRGLFLKGVGLEVVWPQALALVLFASVMMILAIRKFKTRLD